MSWTEIEVACPHCGYKEFYSWSENGQGDFYSIEECCECGNKFHLSCGYYAYVDARKLSGRELVKLKKEDDK